MPAILDAIQEQPLYGLIAVVLVALLVVTILRKLLWVTLILLVGLAIYGVHLHELGGELRAKLQNVKDKVGEELPNILKKQ